MPFKNADDRRDWQRGHNAEHRARRKEYRRSPTGRRVESTSQTRTGARKHRFVGVDGEGYTEHRSDCPAATGPGVGCRNHFQDRDREPCVHHYMCLIVAGEGIRHVLYTGQPLTATQCLGFLADLPVEPDLFYVSFFFDYDTTMILRDMCRTEPHRAHHLLGVRTPTDDDVWTHLGRRRYGSLEFWRGFGVDYVPRKHLTVCRTTDQRDKAGRRVTSPRLTVHDTRAFYQMAFVKALNQFQVGTPAQREHIATMKSDRAGFDPTRAAEIIEYSVLECQLLAQMIGKLRDAFVQAGLSPWPYEGPGPVAGRVLTREVTGPERMKVIKAAVPPQVWTLAEQAYYGGRFEVAAHGAVSRPVYEYDIKSAYPDAMRSLPCLLHGRWEPGRHGGLWVGEVSWSSSDGQPGACGPLPFRRPDSSVFFPTAGTGWYWSVEVPTRGHAVKVHDAWSYIPQCDCKPFAWVDKYYQRRADMEALEKGSGIGLKLTLNSMYGKLAQRVGKAPHYNPVWAGLITALTRAKVYDVYRHHPRKVVMFATDAVFVIEPCPELDLGDKLGQWEHGPEHQFNDFTIFQPGVYFDGPAAKFKTRGVPIRTFTEQADRFRDAATDLNRVIELDVSNHLGIKLAMTWDANRVHNNKQRQWVSWMGNWMTMTRSMTANPERKRQPDITTGDLITHNGVHWSMPITQPRTTRTTPYNHGNEDIVFEDMLDWETGLNDGG